VGPQGPEGKVEELKFRHWLVGLGVALLLGAAALVMAQGAGAQEGGADPGRLGILERVAAKLGIEVETLRDAFKDARLDQIDEALAEGRINEEHAEKARERIEQGKPPLGVARARALHHARHAIVESAASAMGMTPDELRAELKSGASISSVAAERGVSIEDVKAQIISDAETKLADLVAEGRIDQARADDALARLTERIDQIVERSRP